MTHDNTVTLHNLTFSKLILFSSCLSFVIFLFFFVYCVLVVFNSFFPQISRLCFLIFCFIKIYIAEISSLTFFKIYKTCLLLHDFVTLSFE